MEVIRKGVIMFKVMNSVELSELNGGGIIDEFSDWVDSKLRCIPVPWYEHDEKGYLCQRDFKLVLESSGICCYIDGKKQYSWEYVY